MVYAGENVLYTLTLKYRFSYSNGEAMGEEKYIGGEGDEVYFVRFSLTEVTDSYTGITLTSQSSDWSNRAITADMCVPFESSTCKITTTTSNITTHGGLSGAKFDNSSFGDRNERYDLNIYFGSNKAATNVNTYTYYEFLNAPSTIATQRPIGAEKGEIDCSSSGTITIVIDYYVKNPEFSYSGESQFIVDRPITESNSVDYSSRNIRVRFNRPTILHRGTRSPQDARLMYILQEKNIATGVRSVIWTIYDDEIEEDDRDILYEVIRLPLNHRATRDYILITKYDRGEYPQTFESFQTFGPEITQFPSIEMRYIGEHFELTSAEMVNHLISTVHGDAITLWWNNPIIYYAGGLKINFQILVGRNGIPISINDNNILDIVPGDGGGKEYRSFPNSSEYVEMVYRNQKFKTFYLYLSSGNIATRTENLPLIPEGQIVPSNNNSKESDDGMPFLYSYTITNDQFEKIPGIQNYDKIYFSVRPVIEYASNSSPDVWREGTELKEVPLTDQWHPFIYVKETTTYFCSDIYWDETQSNSSAIQGDVNYRPYKYGNLEWRQCQMYYCPDGVNWKLVSAQYSNDEGLWSFC